MVFGNPNIEELPTLRDLVGMIRNTVEVMPVVHRSDFAPVLNDEDMFILTRTNLMYSLKPNITTQGALFAWQSEYSYPNPMVSSLFRHGRPDFMINNVVREDAEIIFDSHPLFHFLRRGIAIPNLRRNIQIYNPYGLAHAYGFPSPFVSLSQSLDIAAYHACHSHDDITCTTTPINTGAGLLIVFQLRLPFSMTPGLSTLGRQAFVRPGVNKLFLFECGMNADFLQHPAVTAFQFRHTTEDTAYFTQIYSGQQTLYPNELISTKLADLRNSRTYSKEALDKNLRLNPGDNRIENIERLRNAGLKQVSHNIFRFTPQELERIWFDSAKERWNDFWSETVFPAHLNFSEDQLTYLFDLPQRSEFGEYFNINRWFENHPLRH